MSQRLFKINELLKREIISCVERNFEFENLLVTIHEVETSPNLKAATVFVGVIGDKDLAKNALAQLNRRSGFIQNEMMKRVTLRSTPVLRFVVDESVERGVHVLSILDQLGEINLPEETKS
jgi:ribosome-binding factor A